MIKTRKPKFPPILLIYLTVLVVFGALISTRIHAADHSPIEARMVTPTQTASL